MDEQTRLEQEHYALQAAYALVQDDIRKLVVARDKFGGDNTRLNVALKVLGSRLDSLALAPNE